MHVLLVHPDADREAARLSGTTAARLTPASTATAARAYLSGAAFDAVLVCDASMAGPVRDAHRALALGVPLLDVADAGAWLRAHAPGAAAPDAAPAPGAGGLAPVLEAMHAEIGRVVHELNNPLAVVLGNLQLGAELARATGADASVLAALSDAEAAAHRLHALFGEVGALRSRLDALRR